ncbi:hypothetical protein Psi02_39400 [Planotetraspora silvatica]|uniref:Uncharacterized protein n=2 Tax=Planotetraspora silvatica TaxID=234614 RepID=A0A8J3UN94_9ACTN|nr:hypothetical protein Psi02_39400 [Planotetraspora silvatica]
MRFVGRVLVPARVRRAFLSRLDARYVTQADHRQDVRNIRDEFRRLHRETKDDRRDDAAAYATKESAKDIAKAIAKDVVKDVVSAAVKDAQRENQSLREEIVALRAEVRALKQLTATVNKANDQAVKGHRLAERTAEALDHVLQNEVRVWQAIDGLSAQTPATNL